MSEEKGIYVSFSTHIGGAVHDELKASIERETHAWIQSDGGQAMIRRTVTKVIEQHIENAFNWYVREDPRAQALKTAIVDELYKELFKLVPRALPPTSISGEGGA